MGLCMSKIKYLNSLSNLNIQASQVQASVECIHVLKRKKKTKISIKMFSYELYEETPMLSLANQRIHKFKE